MNKFEKILRRISPKDQDKIILTVQAIVAGELSILVIKKLSGSEDIYRARVGKFRIKFRVYSSHNEILEIVRRSDHTY